jgi:hypothetical protein
MGVAADSLHCRWIDVVGRTQTKLDRVRRQLGLPPQLVPLSLSEYLQPAAVRVAPAWFLITYFTSASTRDVFTRHPVMLWLADYSIVTISPWARQRSVLQASRALRTTRDGLLCSILESAVASHEEVGRQLNDAFFGRHGSEGPFAWHRKERRVARFVQLLDHQTRLLQAVGMQHRAIRQLHEQLNGLLEIARLAERKLRESGICRVCRREAVRGRPRGS